MHAEPAPEARARRFLVAAIVVLLGVSVLIVWPFLSGTVFALVLGYLLRPTYERVLRVVRWRPVAGALVLLLVLVSIVGPLLFIGYRLVQDARALVEQQNEGGFDQAAIDGLAALGVPEATARDLISRAVASATEWLASAAIPTLTAILGVLVNVAVFFFLLYFVLTDGPRLATFVRRAMPLPPDRAGALMRTIGGRVRALFLGTFLVSIIQGVAAGLGWWYFGFPAPFFWGFVITFLTILPGGAPMLVIAPAGILAILQGNVFAGVGILVYGALIVGTIDNLARPFVVSRGSDVHPAIVFLGTLGGIAAFGATGFIIGPLLMSMLGPVIAEWQYERGAAPAGPEAADDAAA